MEKEASSSSSISSEEESEKKRPHLLKNHSVMARHSSSTPDNDDTHVDSALLQYQNQKLVQQLDVKNQAMRELETTIKNLKDQQASYDNVLITVNQHWNQVVDDLLLLNIQVGAGKDAFQSLDHSDKFRGSIPLSCPVDDIFTCRLLGTDSLKSSINESLGLRKSSTVVLMDSLEKVMNSNRATVDNIVFSLLQNHSIENVTTELSKFEDRIKEEVKLLKEIIEVLKLKHIEYANAIETCNQNRLLDEPEIKRLKDELEDTMCELEESKRKLSTFEVQKNDGPVSVTQNGNVSLVDKTTRLRELKDSLEETKAIANDRLSELQDAQDDNLILIKQLQDLQGEIKEDKHLLTSRPYVLLNDQLQHWIAESERYKVMTDSLQAERSLIVRREKEVITNSESVDATRKLMQNSELQVEELEHQLNKIISEKNELEINEEDAIQDLARKDVKAEFKVMASALKKELSTMKSQLNRWKETGYEAVSLRKEGNTLTALVKIKTNEQKDLNKECINQMEKIKSLKALIEKMNKEKEELQIFLDLLSQNIHDTRDLMEIKESEQRGNAQAELLKNALDEHGLELRVKAAKEAEAAYKKRLLSAEAEIAEIKDQIDASHRGVLEIKEAIKMKEAEAETYITEIETIGQAYEDMQTQNQHLSHQVTERDEYNITLVSESVKTKQTQSLIVSEKQTLTRQFEHINESLESFKSRIIEGEEQMNEYLREALDVIPEDKHFAITLESTKRELSDSEREMKYVKSTVFSCDKEHEQIQRKMENIESELDSERNERKKLDEETNEVNRIIIELTSESGEAAIQRLEEEIKECKAILKCGVCLDRPKEVVIVKCYHLFCNQCIQRNLEIRHRKCPGCGTAFGQNDVRAVKM